ncbi:hypothetical protein FSARC_2858 [Fusarium sarcochroum]|uniref:Mandelate racemase/muconate lactonizing enzyme C-terminal domain-containing protein n=1 Tax=Fusarium sarcochroum TaxID=1208366 RepID=A0A8H4U543_9HYPO|nr:hypothetical protein FSARC_2858 [Fusarium sarcochroum]
MRITEVTVFSYDANYSYGSYSMSGGRVATGQKSIGVRIRTDDNVEGWAETAPLSTDYLPSFFEGELAALKLLGPHVLGLDPRSPATVSVVMDAALLSGLGTPEIGVKKAQAELDKGLKAMQLEVGDDPINDANRVRAVRKALPSSIDIWADANGGWNLDQALTFARFLGSDVAVPLEQPCASLSDSAEVGCRTGLPIALDESIVTMKDLLAAKAAGITAVNIKPSRVGGFTKARTLRDAAVDLDMMVTIDDTWGCALATAQNLQLAISTRPDRLRAVDLFPEWTNPLVADIPRMNAEGGIEPGVVPGNGFGAVYTKLLGEPLLSFQA